MGRNQRRHKRFSVDLLDINGRIMFAEEVRLRDISVSGVALETDKRLNIGTEYLIKLVYQQQVISVRGSVVWSRLVRTTQNRRGDTVPFYSCGMQFTAVSMEKIGQLLDFIRDCARNRLEEPEGHMLSGLRCNVRYRVDGREKAVVNATESCRVKKISNGGMLIGGGHVFEVGEQYPMEVCLPDDKVFSFVGRIASCVPDAGDGSFSIGVAFSEMSEKDKGVLDSFVRALNSGMAADG